MPLVSNYLSLLPYPTKPIHTFFNHREWGRIETLNRRWFPTSIMFYLALFLYHIKMHTILVWLFFGKMRRMTKMVPWSSHQENIGRMENPLTLQLFWPANALILMAILGSFGWVSKVTHCITETKSRDVLVNPEKEFIFWDELHMVNQGPKFYE